MNLWSAIAGFFGKVVEKGTDVIQDAGAAAGKKFVKDIKIEGNPTVVIQDSQIRIDFSGNLNIIDTSRNKVLLPLEVPMSFIITIPRTAIVGKVDGKLYN